MVRASAPRALLPVLNNPPTAVRHMSDEAPAATGTNRAFPTLEVIVSKSESTGLEERVARAACCLTGRRSRLTARHSFFFAPASLVERSSDSRTP